MEAPSLSTLRISDPAIALVSTRPSREGDGIILHLREVEGRAVVAQVEAAAPKSEVDSLSEVSVLEEPIKQGLMEISFAPFEVKFLKVRIRQSGGAKRLSPH